MPVHLLPAPADRPASTRRAFLGRLALGGVAAVLGRPAAVAARDDEAPWYALVADIHIAADRKAVNRGQVMADNLRAVVADILDQPLPPRGVLINGDLALRDGQEGDYRTFLDLIAPLRQARLPVHLALGNHDDRGRFRAVLHAEPPPDRAVIDRHVSVVAGPGLRLVLLDSLVTPNSTPGRLGGPQLGWLGTMLDADPRTPALVFVHHNPSTVNPTALLDTAALLEVLRPRRQVQALVFGHTHAWDVSAGAEGLHLVNLPAVAYPFADDQPLGWCRLALRGAGAELELRCVGGERTKDGQRVLLGWRPA